MLTALQSVVFLKFPPDRGFGIGAKAAAVIHRLDVIILEGLVFVAGGFRDPQLHFHNVLIIHPAQSGADQICTVSSVAGQVEYAGSTIPFRQKAMQVSFVAAGAAPWAKVFRPG